MKKYILSTLVIAMVLVAFAFSPTTTNHKDEDSLFWYKVTYDNEHLGGYIPSEDDFYVQSEKNQVNSPCDEGVDKDCLRGFATEITSFPVMAAGTEQIKRPN
jgi:hypothetical protein